MPFINILKNFSKVPVPVLGRNWAVPVPDPVPVKIAVPVPDPVPVESAVPANPELFYTPKN